MMKIPVFKLLDSKLENIPGIILSMAKWRMLWSWIRLPVVSEQNYYIAHIYKGKKKINCWLTYLIKYSVILSCVRVLSYSDRMNVLEDGDKPEPMASILWLSSNTLSSETVKMLYKKTPQDPLCHSSPPKLRLLLLYS